MTRRSVLAYLALCNWPRLVLVGIALASLRAGMVSHAPNRLLSGVPMPTADAHGLFSGLVALVVLSLPPEERRGRSAVFRNRAAVVVACFGVLSVLTDAGEMAASLASRSPPAARTMLGAGFWGLCFAFVLVAVDGLQRLRARPRTILLVAALLPLAVTALALSGQFDSLSLAQEAASHRAAFGAAVLRHLLLVGATLGLALLLGTPLGVAVQRRRAWRGPVFSVLNIVQTVPSVALFGLLITPLAAAGLSGIGPVPALIALVAYALLPVVRAMVAGLDGVDAATLDAAAGLGLSPGQVLLAVALPLAAPALIAGFRIVTVQTIGLAVIAALIGAGGLGDFVFQGLGQYAVDLVLLGALPAIGLALAADLLLRLAVAPLQARLA